MKDFQRNLWCIFTKKKIASCLIVENLDRRYNWNKILSACLGKEFGIQALKFLCLKLLALESMD